MATVTSLAELSTVAELVEHLGGIPPERIRLRPTPGTATEHDVVELNDRDNRLYELVDGVLVEKSMGFYESLVAIELARLLSNFVNQRRLGLVAGTDGMMRLAPGLVRIPDVAYISRDRLATIRMRAIPDLAPNLAVEVLSPSNTRREMTRKLADYFEAGVLLVWYIDPVRRACTVYTSPDDCRVVDEDEPLDGGEVLPGFEVRLREVFDNIDGLLPERRMDEP